MTIVEGDTGLILFDPLISMETSRAALELDYAHRPGKPGVSVLYSHSHVDHCGGVRGVVSEEDVQAGKVMVVAPVGFLQAAVAENVFAGNAMSRRSSYMYGNLLPPDPKGQVGRGIRVACSSRRHRPHRNICRQRRKSTLALVFTARTARDVRM